MTCQIQISESQNLGRGRMTGVGVVTRGVALVAAVWHRVALISSLGMRTRFKSATRA